LIFYFYLFTTLSKNTLLLDTLKTIASTVEHSESMDNSFAAKPTENITLLSILWSAILEHILPIAIPKSLELKKQGASGALSSFSLQEAKPQYPQSKPKTFVLLPIRITA
jgi:hypothetical protein